MSGLLSIFFAWNHYKICLTQIRSVILVTAGVSNHPFRVRVVQHHSLIHTLCIWHRYHPSTCPVWLFGPRPSPRLYIFRVHSSIFILDDQGPGSSPWQESMYYFHFLALSILLPLLPDLAAQMEQPNTMGPISAFLYQFLPLSTLLQFFWVTSSTISQFILKKRKHLPSINIFLSIIKNLSTEGNFYIYPLTIGFRVGVRIKNIVLTRSLVQLICVE